MAETPVPHDARGNAALSLAGVRLTFRGLACVGASVLALVVAYATGRPQFLSIGALLAALPVSALVYVVVRRPRVQVARSCDPQVVSAGSPTTITLAVSNGSGWQSPVVRWADELDWPPFATREAELPALATRGARLSRPSALTLTYSVSPPRRGVFDIGPVTLGLRDAFGLALSVTPAGDSARLIVTPEVIELASRHLTAAAGDGQSRVARSRSTGDDDDATTREYRQGDAMRRVHWKATARKGDLMVRQEEQRSIPDARIVFETRRSGYEPRGPQTRPVGNAAEPENEAFEWSVRMLASVAACLSRSGFHVTVDETGAPQLDGHGLRGRSSGFDDHGREQLASIALVGGPGRAKGPTTGAGPIIGILGEPDADLVDWLVQLRQPGELAIAFLVSPASALDELAPHLARRDEVPESAARLLDSGWLVVPVRAHDDHAAAWDIALEAGWSRAAR